MTREWRRWPHIFHDKHLPCSAGFFNTSWKQVNLGFLTTARLPVVHHEGARCWISNGARRQVTWSSECDLQINGWGSWHHQVDPIRFFSIPDRVVRGVRMGRARAPGGSRPAQKLELLKAWRKIWSPAFSWFGSWMLIGSPQRIVLNTAETV